MIAPSLVLFCWLSCQTSDEDSAPRAHDLSVLLSTSGRSGFAFDLCSSPPRNDAELDTREEPEEASPFTIYRIIEVLQEIASRRWPEDEVRLAASGDTTLLVEAPEHVDDEIARILDFIQSACLGEERLQLRVIAGAGVLGAPLLLDIAEADRQLAELVASRKARVVREATVALQDGLVGDISAIDTQTYTGDYDVEIAGASGVYDPVMESVDLGLEASVRATRAQNGTYLDLAVRYVQPDRWRKQLFEPMVHCLSEEKPSGGTGDRSRMAGEARGSMLERMPIRIEFPLDRFLSWAGSIVLPAGKALWMPCRVTTQAGEVAYALELRVTGRQRAAQETMSQAAANAPEITILHHGALSPSGLEIESLVDAFDTAGSKPSCLPSPARTQPHEASLRNLVLLASPQAMAAGGVYLGSLSPWHFVLQATSDVRTRLIGDLAGLLESPPLFELSGRVLSGDRVLGEFRVPVLTDRSAALRSGCEGSFLADWDVDVANDAAIANPQIDWFLDGLALRFLLHRLLDGRLQLAVNGKLHFLTQPPTLEEVANPYTPSYEKIEMRSLFLDEIVRLVDTKNPTVRFGDQNLALEITVARR